MIKSIVWGALCMMNISIFSAKDLQQPVIPQNVTKQVSQKIPKSVILKTKKFKIKIDQQPDGKYLYQSWPANGKITSKPSMIISGGELIPDGTGGSYYFEFGNEGYTYQVWRNYLTDSPKKAPYTLTVEDQDGKTIVKQDAVVVKN
ncbi:hypothetical protein [Chryseobacterium nepalense]|uniref:Bulb-type lectin domain-containing protein n=1 Tax=Chryseobacterium nepalense TaxID=1854498 RepID=A0ABY4KB48_9FLAO|nr:hypothetical protein [Chryseobacterium nepalense]UPQ77008.1 hypothetical protein M0D58_05495 [Chryseobacterium nepalense]